MRTLLLLSFFIQSAIAFSQDSLFTKVYFQESIDFEATATENRFGGGLIIAAKSMNEKSAIFAIDSLGTQLWNKTYNLSGNTWEELIFSSVIATKDSSYLVTGKAKNPNSNYYSGFCMKIDRLGDTLWTRSFLNPENSHYTINSAKEMSDSTYFLAGNIGVDSEIFAARLSADGDLLWSSVFQFSEEIYANAISQTPDSSFLIAGYTYDEINFNEGFLLKVSSENGIEWATRLPDFVGIDIETTNSGIVVFGQDQNSSLLGLLKTDFDGEIIWQKTYNESSNLSNGSFKQFSDSSFRFITKTEHDCTIVKLDKDGEKEFNSRITMQGLDVLEAANKGIFIVGNGPLIGIKALYHKHIGVIRADSLFNNNECMNLENNNSTTSSSPAGTPLSITMTGSIDMNSFPIELGTIEVSEQTGCVSIFGGVNENSLHKEILVYPNSSSGIFMFEQQDLSSIQIVIIDASGKEIHSTQSNQLSTAVDLSENSSGVYFYKITDSDKRRANGKLIILK